MADKKTKSVISDANNKWVWTKETNKVGRQVGNA
jgi:hypothetical protein